MFTNPMTYMIGNTINGRTIVAYEDTRGVYVFADDVADSRTGETWGEYLARAESFQTWADYAAAQ